MFIILEYLLHVNFFKISNQGLYFTSAHLNYKTVQCTDLSTIIEIKYISIYWSYFFRISEIWYFSSVCPDCRVTRSDVTRSIVNIYKKLQKYFAASSFSQTVCDPFAPFIPLLLCSFSLLLTTLLNLSSPVSSFLRLSYSQPLCTFPPLLHFCLTPTLQPLCIFSPPSPLFLPSYSQPLCLYSSLFSLFLHICFPTLLNCSPAFLFHFSACMLPCSDFIFHFVPLFSCFFCSLVLLIFSPFSSDFLFVSNLFVSQFCYYILFILPFP